MSNPEVAAVAQQRLLGLPPEVGNWRSAAQILLGSSAGDVTALVAHAGPVRPQLLAELARRGDAAARKEVIALMIEQVKRGEDPKGPHWPNAEFDASFGPVLRALAIAADTQSKALQFAVSALGQIVTSETAAFVQQLAEDRGHTWWLEVTSMRLATELATTITVGRMKDDPIAAAHAFLEV